MLKNVDDIRAEIIGKSLDLHDIDDYMVDAGYESILPANEEIIRESGLIWYPFEPFLNQINIFVSFEDNKYIIEDIELFSDVDADSNLS